MASIKFDNVEIITTAYNPRFVQHESAPDRDIDLYEPSRSDGDVLIYERYGAKVISLQGMLTAANSSALETAIDTMKELFSRVQKNLDIDWAGGTRRYVATCSSHKIERDYWHIDAVPWSAEFTVPLGYGQDTGYTDAYAGTPQAITVTAPAAGSFSLLGSKPPRPIITIDGSVAATDFTFPETTKSLQYKNTDTGELLRISLNEDWTGSNKKIIIDTEKREVRETLTDGTEHVAPFVGVIPTFKVGTNNIEISMGDIILQQSDTPPAVGGSSAITSTQWYGQSFVLQYPDETVDAVKIAPWIDSGTPGNMIVEIHGDLNGHPDSSALATVSIPQSAFPSSQAGAIPVRFDFTELSLAANTPYWILMKAGSTGTYRVSTLNNGYAYGDFRRTTDSGATWRDPQGDAAYFQVLAGGHVTPTRPAPPSTPTYNPATGGNSVINATIWEAQGFQMLQADDNVTAVKISPFIDVVGGGPITVRIETDNAGKPSGTLVDANATATILQASVTATTQATATLLTASLAAAVHLNANTPYWIVMKALTPTGGGQYRIGTNTGIYSGGSQSRTTNSGTSWTLTSGTAFQFEVVSTSPTTNLGKVKHGVSYKKTWL